MKNSLPILVFHAIDDSPINTSFPPALFQQLMASFHQAGYQTISLTTLNQYLRDKQPLPAYRFVITFDDGFQSVYQQALPILQQFNFNATLFAITGKQARASANARLLAIDDREMLSWSQLRELQKYNFTIGSHTLSHTDLTRIAPADQITELEQSKIILEQQLGNTVNTFAYPYGYYHQQSRELVRQFYQCACSCRLSLVSESSDRYLLERVEAYYFRDEKLLPLLLSPLLPWYLRARKLPRAIRQTIMRKWHD